MVLDGLDLREDAGRPLPLRQVDGAPSLRASQPRMVEALLNYMLVKANAEDLFTNRENLLLLTLDGHLLHGKQAQPLCFARDAPRCSHRVQLGLACFACYAGGAVVRKFASSSYESWTSQCGGRCGQIVKF